VFSIFPSKGFGSDFFKIVVGRRIIRRMRVGELTGWWECA